MKCKVGKESMSNEDLAENIETILTNIVETLKRGVNNIGSVYVKLTMGSAVKLL